MSCEKKKKTAKIFAIIIFLSGLSVMGGWFLNFPFLVRIYPTWPAMPFETAIAFVLSGITLFFIVRAIEGEFDKAQLVLSITSFFILLFIGIIFISAIFNIHTGFDDAFSGLPGEMPKQPVSGRLSIPVMLNFVLIGIAGIVVTLKPDKYLHKIKCIGIAVVAVGLPAICGYGLDVAVLYYYIEGINAAMACHSAVLFVLLGTGLLCLYD